MRRQHLRLACVAALACLDLAACHLRRPDVPEVRTIEPDLNVVETQDGADPGAVGTQRVDLRLIEAGARVHIGRRLIHQQGDGELIEDSVWRWSSPPDRYLDTALQLTLGSNARIRLVDSADAPVLAVTLLAFHIAGDPEWRLLAAIELRFTGTDRGVHTQLIRDSEPMAGPLPGNLSVVAGRLLGRLAAEASKQVIAMR